MEGKKIVIIDPQHDFTALEGFYAIKHKAIHQMRDALQRINNLLARTDKDAIMILRSDYRPDQFAPGQSICLPGTTGNQIDRDLAVDPTYTFITKTEHSAFKATAFTDYLKATKTTTLFICGFLAEYCVRQTALDALQGGYTVYLVEDCIGTGDDVQQRRMDMIEELQEKGARMINSTAL
ncbi:cysteine hydrolase family protein [Chitinophaga agri]|uniref:Cysteine hydrolase n=1 Tax=Chitinophaga agri TaxID=2703787 RepID=A0A6B9Z869_9BACT|nr:isochorismatase family cysteine hydrolase [Chitinophaga agri]QHS58069.1 cysteine hydrolase [Chitinophaga agri]